MKFSVGNIWLLLGAAFFLGAPGTSAGDEEIAATVNGAPIAKILIEEAAKQIAKSTLYHGTPSDDEMKEFRRRALESLIDQELAYQYGESLGMKPDRKAVKDGMNRLRKQFPSKKEYETALRRDGITEKELKKRVEKDSVASQAYAKAVTESASISEEALKAYYDDNKEKFQQPEKIRLRMISTKDEVKAKEALARLGKGEDFGDVASKMSEDAYRVKGGDMGFIHKGRLIPELEKAGFGLAPGEISGLINAEGTWFILKHEGTMPSKLLAFDEIKAKLKSELETKRARELKDKWLAELRAKAKIEVLKAD